jgi:hypothetical protein
MDRINNPWLIIFAGNVFANGGSKIAPAEMTVIKKKRRMTAFLVHCAIIHKSDA